MLNKVMLIGRMGKDPEMRYTPSGAAVTNFSIATNRKWRDKQGNLQDETTWHDIVCWSRTAEFVAEYGAKGRLVFVEGNIQKRSWEDRDGNKRTSVEVRAFKVQLLDRGDRTDRRERKDNDSEKPEPEDTEEEDVDTEDDVPF